MLKKLEIQNYAIIEKLEISFSEGLTIITGETGAGKSILLGALGLIMGKRADTKVLYVDNIKCYVEATFNITSYNLRDFFEQEEIEYFDELIIRREISQNGKSRAFINDSPVTLEILSSLTEELIDIHQQFDTLDIQKPIFQIQMIDAVAGNQPLLNNYSSEFKQYKSAARKLSDLKEKSRNANQEIDFLSFQMNEFEEANLKENEKDDLEIQLAKLTAAEEIKKNSGMLAQGLSEDQFSVLNQIQTLTNQFGTIRNFDSIFNDIYERLTSIKEELSDISREALKIAESTEQDEESIFQISSRLSMIYRLENKHGVSDIASLLEIKSKIKEKLDSFGDISDIINSLEKDMRKSEIKLNELAVALSQNRHKVIPEFENKVHEMLVSLAMENAYIQVKIEQLNFFNLNGTDDISILFAPNKGSAFLPLKDTASGGELSRLALCIKSQVAGAITLPTLIYDEIDAGVSGEIAHKMGRILTEMSDGHQVICITHSPQIAARADSHYFVFKTETRERTITSMKALTVDERVVEIAKMLSGNPPTDIAKANAKELIGL
ncbi:MAG: DNA repair protein RecN [Saprospiraceae bacterium]|nr:DNA repair protein RecN [Saprospiraceae bacterium]